MTVLQFLSFSTVSKKFIQKISFEKSNYHDIRDQGSDHESYRRGTLGFAVLRYRVSFLCGIAVLREKIGGIAVLSFYSAICGIRKDSIPEKPWNGEKTVFTFVKRQNQWQSPLEK